MKTGKREMAKNIDVILQYEHKVRELESLLNIKALLEDMGKTVKISSIWYENEIDAFKYKPKMVVSPFCYSESVQTYTPYSRRYDENFIKLNLHQEQLFNEDSKKFMLPNDSFSKNVYHIAWGENFSNALKSSGVSTDHIKITGSPRLDLSYFYGNVNYKERLAEKYGIDKNKKWIIFPTNFSLAFVDQEYINRIKENGFTEIEETVEFMKSNFSIFKDWINQLYLDINNQEYQIIIRPHPFVDINKYKTAMGPITNEKVVVLREDSPYVWLSAADKIFVWTSTIAIEAFAMSKRVFGYSPLPIPKKMSMDFMNFIQYSTNYDEFKRMVINNDDNGIEDINSFVKENFYALDGYSTRRIANFVNDLLISNKIDFPQENKGNSIKDLYHLSKNYSKVLLFKAKILDKIFPKYKGLLQEYPENIENYFKPDLLEKYRYKNI
jgi:surface carbohydrate biosynthesis protein